MRAAKFSMFWGLLLSVPLFFFQNCSLRGTSVNSQFEGSKGGWAPGIPITNNIKMFIFGHSLIVHDPPAIPTPSDETSVPHWLFDFANQAGYTYQADGQYGFLRNHAVFPPRAQWGFDHVPSVWTNELESFSQQNFNTVMITPANFIQFQGPNVNYVGDTVSPVNVTLSIVDQVLAAEPTARIYIYENWPDMSGYISSFPPTPSEFQNYNNYTTGAFHNWWIQYHDALIAARPGANIKLIPVGPLIAEVLSSATLPLTAIPILDIYEDDAPHGRPTLYFLAAIINYMAVYGVRPPADYVVPNTVSTIVRNNYDGVVDFLWDRIEPFNRAW